MLAVVCVLRGGGEYRPEHVCVLYNQVKRFYGAIEIPRFVALTDQPINYPGIEERPLTSNWPGWWSKMELFTAAHDDLGDILYVDLDTMVFGSIDTLLGVGKLTMLADFYKPQRLNSGVMFLPKIDRPEVQAAWLEDPKGIRERFKGDGDFLNALWLGKAATWQDELPGQVCSYKVHVRKQKKVPAHAKLVCFHGKPRPWESPLW